MVQSNWETDVEPYDASSTDSLFKLEQYFKMNNSLLRSVKCKRSSAFPNLDIFQTAGQIHG